MTDLTDRLREHAKHDPRRKEGPSAIFASTFVVVKIAPDLLEAADRIDQLESRLDHAQNLYAAAKVETERLRDGIAELLQAGEHEGPCISYEGQDAEGYDGYEPCIRHTSAYERRAAIARVLLDGDPALRNELHRP